MGIYSKMVNDGNGGENGKFRWDQELLTVTLYLPRNNISSKELDIQITRKRLKVSIQGNILIDGDLPNEVDTNVSMWMMDENEITIESIKAKAEWWTQAVIGFDNIDTSECIPEPVSYSELDSGTQMEVERLMEKQRNDRISKAGAEAAAKAKAKLKSNPLATLQTQQQNSQAQSTNIVPQKTRAQEESILDRLKRANPDLDFSGANINFSSPPK